MSTNIQTNAATCSEEISRVWERLETAGLMVLFIAPFPLLIVACVAWGAGVIS